MLSESFNSKNYLRNKKSCFPPLPSSWTPANNWVEKCHPERSTRDPASAWTGFNDMTKYLESSCLQQISRVIKVGVLPRHHASLVPVQQALRSPSQSVPTTSALHVHTRHACSFQNARKSNHSTKQKKCNKAGRCLGTLEYFLPLFFCFFSSAFILPLLPAAALAALTP